jgi:hypothetical protein
MMRFIVVCFALLISCFSIRAQTLGFCGGAGISFDHFAFDRTVVDRNASLATGPLAVAGLRYHTRQNFDITLDASIGITKIKIPVPDGFDGSMKYEQLQSLIMLGSGLNIPFEKSNLLPFIQIGAGFFDFWSVTTNVGGAQSAINSGKDQNTNRWVVVCGAGIDYQFKLFLSSGLNLRLVYTPLDVFKEPVTVASFSNQHGAESVQVQGKLLQAQLTYRVNLPLARWKDRYD